MKNLERAVWWLIGYALLACFFASKANAMAPVQQAPTDFKGTATSTTSIQWTWTDTLGESFYVVHDHQTDAVIAMLPSDTPVFDETQLAENTQYARHVHASFFGVLSPPSNPDVKYTFVHTATGGDFTVQATSSSSIQITVLPPPNAFADQTGVEIIRTLPDPGVVSGFSQVYTVNDTGLQPNTEYCYNIQFRNGDGIPSGFSPTSICATTGGEAGCTLVIVKFICDQRPCDVSEKCGIVFDEITPLGGGGGIKIETKTNDKIEIVYNVSGAKKATGELRVKLKRTGRVLWKQEIPCTDGNH